MEVLNTFLLNGGKHLTTVVRENQSYFFAKEICEVLEEEYDEQKGEYMSERDMYLFVMRSRKDAAQPFQNWLCDIACDIRKNGVVKERSTCTETGPTPTDPTLNGHFRDLNWSRGSKIQTYLPDGKTLVNTYANSTTACRATKANLTSIRSAILQNTVYLTHRWHAIDRNLPDDTVCVLTPTVESGTIPRSGCIAVMEPPRTCIKQVFPDQKSFAKEYEVSPALVSQVLSKPERMCNGHYLMYFENCQEELKAAYLAHSSLPDPPVRITKSSVEQRDPQTNAVLRIFPSMSDVMKNFQVSRLSLKNAIEKKDVCHNYRWAYVG